MKELGKMRAEANFGSWDDVAEQMFKDLPKLREDLKGPRSLATKLSELARGKRTWWDHRPDFLQCLADVLGVELDALRPEPPSELAVGLLPLPWLPFLDPVDLRSESLWSGPAVVSGNHIVETPLWALGGVLGDQYFQVRWLTLADELERSAIIWLLKHQGFDVRTFDTLAHAPASVSKCRRPAVVVVERADPQQDFRAVRSLHSSTVSIVIAPFALPDPGRLEIHSVTGWDFQDRLRRREPVRIGKLFDRHDTLAVQRPQDWRESFVRWVCARRARGESLLDNAGAAQWLSRHDRDAWIFRDCADVAHMLTVLSESGPAADPAKAWLRGHLLRCDGLSGAPEAWLRCVGADVLTGLVFAAWREDAEVWDRPRSPEKWAALLVSTGYAPSAYAVGATAADSLTKGPRPDTEARKDHENRKRHGGGPEPFEGITWLETAGLLRRVSDGLAISPPWLPRWLLAKHATRQLQGDGIEDLFDFACSPSRREVIEQTLARLSFEELSKAVAAAGRLPADSFASLVASEILLREVARRLESDSGGSAGNWLRSEDVVGLASRAVASGILAIEHVYFVRHLITRQPRHVVESKALDLAVDCWTVSMAAEPPADRGPPSLFPAWHADGWKELSAHLRPALDELAEAAAGKFPNDIDSDAKAKLEQRAQDEYRQLARQIHAMATRWTMAPEMAEKLPAVMLPGVLLAMAAQGIAPPINCLREVATADWREELVADLARRDPKTMVRIAASIAGTCARSGRWLEVLFGTKSFVFEHPLAHFVAENLSAAELAALIPEIGLPMVASQWNWLRPELREVVARAVAADPAFDLAVLEGQLSAATAEDAAGLGAIVRSRPGQAILCSHIWRFLPELAAERFAEALQSGDQNAAHAWLCAVGTGHFPVVIDLLERDATQAMVASLRLLLADLIPEAGLHAPRLWKVWRGQSWR